MTKQYPDAPGYKEGTTSKDAADSVKERAGKLRALVQAGFESGWRKTHC